MRLTITFLFCSALAGCSTAIPESGPGFDNYDAYQAERLKRDAALTGNALPSPTALSSESALPGDVTVQQPASDAEVLAADARAALEQTQANSGQPVVNADPDNPPPQTVATATGISAENDFEAVGAERSIESDAALIEQNRAQYKVIEPTALPTRSGSGGPNIVEYALSSSHPIGTSVYRRTGLNREAKFQRNCAKYPSSDKAQIDFLARGGPTRDRLGLDPDGDGYACAWDPTPFRAAVSTSGGG